VSVIKRALNKLLRFLLAADERFCRAGQVARDMILRGEALLFGLPVVHCGGKLCAAGETVVRQSGQQSLTNLRESCGNRLIHLQHRRESHRSHPVEQLGHTAALKRTLSG
jgi:hypothetical protein